MKDRSIHSKFLYTSEEVRNAYNQSYSESDFLRDTDASYRWVLNKLGVVPGKHLLDIAFGLGILLKEAHLKGLHVTGIEISSTAAQIVQRSLPFARLVLADGEALPFANATFDYVTNLGSLEHFLHPERGIQEIIRVLKPDGRAAILLPNAYYLPDLILKVWLKGYGPNHHQIVERFAAANEWRDYLEQNGLQVQKIYKYNFMLPQNLRDWNWFARHPRRLIPPLLGLFIPFNFSFSFLYICKPTGQS